MKASIRTQKTENVPSFAARLALLFLLLVIPAAYAASGTWTNLNGGSWTNTSNWSGGTIADGSGNSANFSSLNLSINPIVTLDAARTITSLTFDDLNSTKHNWTLNTGSAGSFTLAGSTPTFTVNSATNSVNAVIAGTAGLTKAGAGKLVLGGANTYTGTTAVSAGTLAFGSVTYSSTNTLTIAASSFVESAGTLTLPVSSVNPSIAVSGAGTLRLTATNNSAASPDIYFGPNHSGTTYWGMRIATPVDLGSSQRYFFGKTGHNGVGKYALTSADCQFAGAISGSGGMTLIGQNNLSDMEVPFCLNAANSFTGPVEIQRASLYLGIAGALNGNVLKFTPSLGNNARFFLWGHNVTVTDLQSPGAGTSVIADGNSSPGAVGPATLTITQNNPYTYSGGISDVQAEYNAGGSSTPTLSLIKNGSAALTLSGPGTFTGTATISVGKLYLNNSFTGGGIVTVASSATLGGSGSVSSVVTVNSGGIIEAGSGSGSGTLNLNSLTLSGIATLNLALNSTPATLNVTVNNGLVANGGANSVTINVGGSAFAMGQYPLITYAGSLGGSGFVAYKLGTLPARVSASLVNNTANHSIDLLVSPMGRWSGALGSEWSTNTLASPKNWVLYADGVTPADYVNGDAVLFDDTATNTTVDISVADITPAGAMFNNSSHDYSLIGSKAIAGTASITKAGSGTLTVAGNHTYTGQTVVSGGKLVVTGSLTGGGAVSIGTNATLAGSGTIAGIVTVQPGGVLSPGTGLATLTLGQPPVLTGVTWLEINRTNTPANSDQLAVSGSLAFGGTLVVTNIGPNDFTLAARDTFQLFNATAYTGSFTNLVLPVLATNLAWDISQFNVSGTLAISAPTPPFISTQPQDATAYSTFPATFSVTANGTVPLAYQWLKNGTNITGANGSSYTIASTSASDAGIYTVMVTNLYGSILSSNANLVVLDAPPTTVTNGLVVYLNFDNNLNAQGGTTNNGTAYTGGAMNGPRYTAGKIGAAATFTNTAGTGQPNDWAVTLGSLEGIYSNSFSVSIWERTISSTDGALIGNKNWTSGGNVGWAISKLASKNVNWNATGGTRQDVGLTSFSDGNWHLITVTFDRTTNLVSCYIDGSVGGAGNISPSSAASINAGLATLIGSSGNGTYSGTGDVDDLGIWSRALTASEVAEIYTKGQMGRNLTQPPAPPAPTVTIGPWVRFTGVSNAVVYYQSSTNEPSIVEYGTTASLGTRMYDATSTNNHCVALSGLLPKTLYYFVVKNVLNGLETPTSQFTFETDYNYTIAPITNAAPYPYPNDSLSAFSSAVAQAVLTNTGITKGYALDYGCGDGRLALELARNSDLNVIGVSASTQAVAQARQLLQSAGLYGSRVRFIAAPLNQLPYVKNAFNLVVSSDALQGSNFTGTASEVCRVLRPDGGMAMFGLPPGVSGSLPNWSNLDTWLRNGFTTNATIVSVTNSLTVATTLPLSGAGEWTHGYGDAGATASSHDKRIKGSGMKVQWFGEPGPRGFLDRGTRPPQPLVTHGFYYNEGNNRVFAQDAYNGRILWELEIPNLLRVNVPRDASNMCADSNSLYLTLGNDCLQLDAYSGQLVQTYSASAAANYDWGFVACVSNLVYGSTVKHGSCYTDWASPPINWYDSTTDPAQISKVCSENLFCFAKTNGTLQWAYTNGVIINSTIVIGGGRIYFVDSRNPAVLGLASDCITSTNLWVSNYLVALDAASGAVLWQQPVTITSGTYPVTLFLSYSAGKLVFNDSTTSFAVNCYSATNGSSLWSKSVAWSGTSHGHQMYHTVIAGTNVIVEPNIYDLNSGTVLKSLRNRAGCNTMSAAEYVATYCESYNTAAVFFWDLSNASQTSTEQRFGGMRASCWMSLISGGGMVLLPAASAGCSCGFPLQMSAGFSTP